MLKASKSHSFSFCAHPKLMERKNGLLAKFSLAISLLKQFTFVNVFAFLVAFTAGVIIFIDGRIIGRLIKDTQSPSTLSRAKAAHHPKNLMKFEKKIL